MTKFKLINFWLLLALGTATMVFNSCDKKDDPQEIVNPNEPNEPTEPTEPNEPGIIAVTGINLDKSALTLIVNEDYTLTATVLPANATNKTVIWTSSDNTKATVANG